MVGLEASGWAAGPPTTGQQCLPPLAQQKVGYLRPGLYVALAVLDQVGLELRDVLASPFQSARISGVGCTITAR